MDKKTMIAQGYVPATCELHEDLAAPLIMNELRAGRDPCAGCNHDRLKCHGRPPADSAQRQYHSIQRMEEMTMEAKMQRAIDDDPTFSKNTILGVDMAPGGDKSVGMLVGEDPVTRQRRIWAMWDASSPEARAERNSYDVRGAFVPGPNGGSFRIERLPLPPQGRRVRRLDEQTGERRELIELQLACPHCKQDVTLQYETKKVSPSLADEVLSGLDRERARFRAEQNRAATHDEKYAALLYLEATEQWISASSDAPGKRARKPL